MHVDVKVCAIKQTSATQFRRWLRAHVKSADMLSGDGYPVDNLSWNLLVVQHSELYSYLQGLTMTCDEMNSLDNLKLTSLSRCFVQCHYT